MRQTYTAINNELLEIWTICNNSWKHRWWKSRTRLKKLIKNSKLMTFRQRSANIQKTSTKDLYLVSCTFSITLESKCRQDPLQLFHVGRTPRWKIFPSICNGPHHVFRSYQLYELLQSQLEFKFALSTIEAISTLHLQHNDPKRSTNTKILREHSIQRLTPKLELKKNPPIFKCLTCSAFSPFWNKKNCNLCIFLYIFVLSTF